MKKGNKIFLAIIGGMDVVIYIITPIILGILWLNNGGVNFSAYFLFFVCLFSSLFRAIKIGFLTKDG